VRPVGAWLRLVLGTVGLLGLFGTILATLYEYPDLRIDLTTEQRYTLSRHARQLVSGLDRDVEMIAFLRSQNPRNSYIRDLLQRIGNTSPHVTWAEVDVNRSPAKARQYGVTSYGAIVVMSGGRLRVVTNPREDNLMWAILQVTREQRKTVYFIAGHGEKTPAERDHIQGYSSAAARVGEELYLVRTLLLPRAGTIPDDATVLVIAGPRAAYGPQELDLLDRYLREGGAVLALLDPFQSPDLARHLERYGVVVRDEIIVDPGNRMFGGEFVTMSIPVANALHPIAEGLEAEPVLSVATAVEPGKPPPGVEVRPVLRTSPASWATPDRSVLGPGTPRYRAERDRPGPVTVGVEVRVPGVAGRSDGRLVVLGNSEFASNSLIDREGNADLLLNAINWLADEPTLIAPRLPRKEPGTEQMLVLGDQGVDIFWLAVVVQPSICIVIALLQFWYRRYAS
jgi:ABC-type uncharacterized transport system involved in gliding motility auxiliary subunit